jgi:hypothetical protein
VHPVAVLLLKESITDRRSALNSQMGSLVMRYESSLLPFGPAPLYIVGTRSDGFLRRLVIASSSGVVVPL